MEYWALTEDNMEEILSKIAADGEYFGRDGVAEPLLSYFKNELHRAIINDCALVVFKKEGKWFHLCISSVYGVDYVMQQKWSSL
jgi:hypothetical protein